MTKNKTWGNRTSSIAVQGLPQSVSPHRVLTTEAKNRSLYILIELIVNVYFILFDTDN